MRHGLIYYVEFYSREESKHKRRAEANFYEVYRQSLISLLNFQRCNLFRKEEHPSSMTVVFVK